MAQLVTRSRWIALAALRMLWPKAPLGALSAKLFAKPTSAWGSMTAAERAPWWRQNLVNRVVDAI